MPRKRTKKEEQILIDRVMRDLLSVRECDRVLEVCFTEQLAFIQDESELKAALCTRRCGKTTAATVYLLFEALKTPGVNCIYIALTRGSAKSLMLTGGDDGAFLRKLLDQYNIEAEINLTDLSVRLPNGSVIWLTGTDASPEQSRKLYGQKYQLAIIDEAGSFRQDLGDLVYMKLRPAMAQADGTSGTIALIGTPENNRGFFYRVTCTDADNDKPQPGWSVHQWSYHANPFTKAAIEAQIAEMLKLYPGVSTNEQHQFYPTYQQMYLGRWVMDRNAMVYAYHPDVNLIERLPEGQYTYCAGIDFGFVDAATIVTVAYREHDPTLYVVESFAGSYLDKTDFAIEIVRRKERYNMRRFISDHDPSTIADIQNRFGVYLEQAEKHDKVGFIGIMNADWLRGRIKIVRSEATEPLIKELEKLTWEPKRLLTSGERREDPSLDNHCCDALLYVWRSLFHYLAKPKAEECTDPFANYARRLRMETQRKLKERLRRQRGYRIDL